MALSQRLELRQGQALVMTPQLLQAIKLLQLSNLELAAYVEGELERNPLLERAGEEEASEAAAEPADPSARAERFEDDWTVASQGDRRGATDGSLGAELENVFPDDGPVKPSPAELPTEPLYSQWHAGANADDDVHNLEAYVSAETTLAHHLATQMALAISDPAQRMIGQYLIDLVDEAGYLTGDLRAVADKLGARLEDVEAVLGILQTFDPPGVCARSLPECLSIQLKERDRFDPAMHALVDNLDLLAKRDLATLRRKCGVSEEDLADMIAEIRSLNPKPGLAFGSTLVQPIVPDVFVRAAPDGSWHVELNSDTLPKVLINQRYYARLAEGAQREREKSYVADCLQAATWLVRALDQRAKTILKVSSEIVRQQEAFFAKGVAFLRPLNLRTVADAIGMHESTVSRVTANKYMATNRGIFELKYFFTSAIAAADGGEAHAAEAVRYRIRQLIDGESATDVLSDDAIVEKLRASGINIARRTVAKYREAMHIPSSVQRRREKMARGDV
ncbi:MAG: RNA polymerase factor sigma-54 [Pseudolabrys sp.]|nr:RNA polymerase factor sigma-54 [Pseudolabrys sp.]